MIKHPHARGLGMASQRSRERLVHTLEQEGIHDARVLAAVNKVPRHRFIDEALASRAYDNTALPIGYGQTISQPYVVARMTELLMAVPSMRSVLEIGTGCGYQTAVLAELVEHVYSIERIQALHLQAKTRLQELGYRRTWLRHGDGAQGWSDYAPFDGILVTAASALVPDALLRQLRVGGRMVIPVGPAGRQALKLIQRLDSGYEETNLDPVTFVPLISGNTA